MKKFILNFKASIRFIVSIIISREFAFCYCVLGTVAQVSHTYFLVESISSLDGAYKTIQAVMLSVFISSSLLYFTAISDNEDSDESRKIHRAVLMFTIIEVIINIYYYTRHLLLDRIANNQDYQIFDFIFAIMVSTLIPITIKLYSSNIRAKEWIIAIEKNELATISKDEQVENEKNVVVGNLTENQIEEVKELIKTSSLTEDQLALVFDPVIQKYVDKLETYKDNDNSFDEEKIRTIVTELFNTEVKNIVGSLDKEISSSFEKNQDLFLKQFENKIKLLVQSKVSSLQTPSTDK